VLKHPKAPFCHVLPVPEPSRICNTLGQHRSYLHRSPIDARLDSPTRTSVPPPWRHTDTRLNTNVTLIVQEIGNCERNRTCFLANPEAPIKGLTQSPSPALAGPSCAVVQSEAVSMSSRRLESCSSAFQYRNGLNLKHVQIWKLCRAALRGPVFADVPWYI
jgi:hypothetical protein